MTGLSEARLRTVSANELEAAFDAPEALTIGVEEEVMLLDPESFDLKPCAPKLLERLRDDLRFKAELPASQLEIITAPDQSASATLAALAAGRKDLARVAEGLARPAAAGVHPFAGTEGTLSTSERYDRTRDEYGPVARRQLVGALQVHVAVGDAGRALAVYNALRGYLPELAALAANGAYYAGHDSELASMRPKLSEMLPRQGLPPEISSWEALAAELRWGAASGTVPEPRLWWWELRPHIEFGTLELRVPDAQTTLAEAGGVIALSQALVAWLSSRCEAGEETPSYPTWRIEENRWSACRWGVEGRMADLETGELQPTRERLGRLLDAVSPTASELGSAELLDEARELVAANGAMRQREVAARAGPEGLAPWMAERFTA